jgi:hypothetical protein
MRRIVESVGDLPIYFPSEIKANGEDNVLMEVG